MNTKRKYTDELKQECAKLYKEGYPTEHIAERLGINRAMVSKFALEMGCEPRHKVSKDKPLKCPECGHKNPPKSNFCNHCGCDIRTPEMILVKKVEILRGMIMSLPNRDSVAEADAITRELIAYLEGKVQK